MYAKTPSFAASLTNPSSAAVRMAITGQAYSFTMASISCRAWGTSFPTPTSATSG